MIVASDTLSTSKVRVVTSGAVFAVAWAGANIVHLLTQTRGDLDPVSWVNLAVALWVLGKPELGTSTGRSRGCGDHRHPLVPAAAPDHQLLASLVNLGVLIVYVSLGRPRSVDVIVHAAAPTARVCVLLAYAAAATAK